MSIVAFLSLELPLWLALLLLGLLLAPAGIGGAIFGVVATLPGLARRRLLGATAGWLVASVIAFAAARASVGDDDGDLVATCLAVGVLFAIAAPGTLLRSRDMRRERPDAGSGQSGH